VTADPLARLAHLGEDGQPCGHHEAADLDSIFALAAIGSRVTGFNHDLASKLQGIMMAVDLITDLVERRDDVQLQRATETAQTALREAHALLSANRALTRATARTRSSLRELIESAGDRVGVAVRGEVPEAVVEAMPILAHGLALALDAVSGVGTDRSIDVTATGGPGTVTLRFTTTPSPARNTSELLALAAFVIRRDGGDLCCTHDARLVIRLATS
jgi:signal transduction histidine kinase